MAYSYAVHRCIDCGKKIVIYNPVHDDEKSPDEQTGQVVTWHDLQRLHAKRCRTHAKQCARRYIARLQAEGVLTDEHGC